MSARLAGSGPLGHFWKRTISTSMVAMSARAVLTFARSMNATYWPCAIVARIATTATVIISSSSVNPTPERIAAGTRLRPSSSERLRGSPGGWAGVTPIGLLSSPVQERGIPSFIRQVIGRGRQNVSARRDGATSTLRVDRWRRTGPPCRAVGPAGLFRPRPQALAHDRGQQDAAVGDDEHPVVEHHAVGDEADRGQALADEQPARDAGAGAVDDLLADLPHQGGEQDRGRGPADP